jgi:hypothetical protein
MFTAEFFCKKDSPGYLAIRSETFYPQWVILRRTDAGVFTLSKLDRREQIDRVGR